LFIGIELTTAEFSSAMQPSVPVFTAIIAILFRVESLRLERRDSRAKLAGITLCCAGAILMTF
jgi:drug/metabolite transporter (DMT)-like permease